MRIGGVEEFVILDASLAEVLITVDTKPAGYRVAAWHFEILANFAQDCTGRNQRVVFLVCGKLFIDLYCYW